MQAALACVLMTAALASCEFSVLGTGVEEPDAARDAIAPTAVAEHRRAAEAFELAASKSEPASRDKLLGQAAEEWFAAGDLRRAMRAIESRKTLPGPDESMVLQLLAARMELEHNLPQRALERVLKLPRPLPATLAAEALELEGRARFALGDGGGAVAALVARERGLRDPALVKANERLIWEGLQRRGLSLRPPAGADATARGWLELGSIVAENDTNTLKAALLAWQGRYPRHPANGSLVASWLDETRPRSAGSARAAQRVALVLPLSGRLESAAAAVRDGFLAAHFGTGALGAGRLEVLVFDSEALGPEAAYEAAVHAGADFVVGPLAKAEVSRVAAVERGVPVLALNNLGDQEHAPGGFYQFALSPEEEAEQTAARAISDGHANALALVSSDESGRRLLDSFTRALERGGGRVIAYEGFDPAASDHQSEIKRLLALGDGQARSRALAATIGEKVEFEAHARQDADFLFLGAQAPQARLLRPELRFLFADELPIYATSSVYEPSPKGNEDLDGIVFADMPWIVSHSADDPLQLALRELGSNEWQHRARLYALGYDAYRLVPLLSVDGGTRDVRLPGATGWLTVETDGRIHRQLAFAELRNGAPQPLPDSMTDLMRGPSGEPGQP